ncbi:hypothetical protein [Planktothricoides raciborskii]|uniref:Transposase n=2 Tax=Planktothricoides raciborskii TaxID=132608 RepID=A0AAU8JBH7_9CYAN|nr:hypothetical protein [Planktothricoides raciborskii]MBD2544921.1 hypothetical protein [Planktothricoides raciborskii FACHB-1370]MBD2582986.1 hypothetical protein [Planktothricoides raciborskii FACHB-1261]
MDATQIRALIAGYLNSDNQAKQRLGRCFAVELGLEAGSLGPDGGVDGSGYNENRPLAKFLKAPLKKGGWGGRNIYFARGLISKKFIFNVS